jgi:hypothetical protein
MKLTRRAVAAAVVGAPVWLLSASVGRLGSVFGLREARADQPAAAPTPEPAPEDTALGRFLAREEPGLTSAERKSVRKQVAQLEQALEEIRVFKLSNDVPPSGAFKPLRTSRPHAR